LDNFEVIGACLYKGQGFGNQLWVYSVVRAAALRWGYNYSILNSENFKGKDFLNLDFGHPIAINRTKPSIKVPKDFDTVYFEKKVLHAQFNCDISPFDENIWHPKDGTLLEGPLQSENYIYDYKNDISTCLKVSGPQFDGCVVNIRGGEYKNNADLFLTKQYYKNAMDRIREIDPQCKFLIVTDDLDVAHQYFPDVEAKSSGGVKIILRRFYLAPRSALVGRDFAWLQNARYLILSNSSFSWWGGWTNRYAEIIIAPKYWARHNVSNGFWSQGDSLTRDWLWLDREGKFSTYLESRLELERYTL